MLDWGGGLGHYCVYARALFPDLKLDYTIKDFPDIRGKAIVVITHLVFEQDQEHADGDEKFLQVPDLIGNDIVSRMIRGPGVGEEDEGPDNESGDDGDLAEAATRQADLKYDGS